MGRNPRPISDGGDRDPDNDQFRVVPVQCTEKQRRAWIAQGQNFTGELTTTSDQRRVFRGNTFIGPAICLGEVGSQAAMLLLGGTLEEPANRGVYQGDWCYRTDRAGARWECNSGYGLEIGDWHEQPAPNSAAGLGQYFQVEDGTGQAVVNSSGEIIYIWIPFADIIET